MKKQKNSKALILKRNRKVVALRGSEWKTKLVQGRAEARLNPSRLLLSRIKKGVPQTIAASWLKISPATYGSIERGKRLVTESRAKLLASRLEVPQHNLFDKDGDKYIAAY